MHLLDAGSEKERAAIEQLLAERLAAKDAAPAKPKKAKADGSADSQAEASPEVDSEQEPMESPKSESLPAPKPVEGGSA
jgi:hypothetical protein